MLKFCVMGNIFHYVTFVDLLIRRPDSVELYLFVTVFV